MTATEHQASGSQVRRFRIRRQRHGADRPRVEEFDVAVGPETTLLEALREIRSHQDKSLTLRYSCCHASCGSCGMRANGREVLACVTPLADLGPGGRGPVLVEPLANARVEHDLVVDMRDLYEHLEPAQRPLIRQDDRLAGQEPDSACPVFGRYEDCIECGLCVSACPIAGSDSLYLGPAALAAAWRTVQEPSGADPASVLAWVDDEQGCWRCHASFECTQVCPSGVDPAGATMALRRELTRRKIGQITRRGRHKR
jgi:succinate dehydrogenase / fumarate reductase, iron-sulfur subunit